MISGPFSGFPARSAFHITKQKHQLAQQKRQSAIKQTPPRSKERIRQHHNKNAISSKELEIAREKWVESDICVLEGLRNCKEDMEFYLVKVEREERVARKVYEGRWGRWNQEWAEGMRRDDS